MDTLQRYNQFQAMFAIAKASLRSMLQSPSAVIFTLAFPLIFIVVFGFIGGGNIKLNIGLAKNSLQNNGVYQTLATMPSVNLVLETDSIETNAALKKGELDALIDIQQDGVGGRLKIHMVSSEASLQNRTIVKSVLNGVILDVYKQNPALATDALPVDPTITETVISGRLHKTIDFILPGQLGFALLSSGVFGVAFVFLTLRQTMVLKRFFATPIKRPFILLGEAVARLTFALTGAAIIIIVGKYAFGFTLINGLVTFAEMMLLSLIGLVVFMGFGFLISGLARNESSVPPLANIVTLPQFLLSATFFP
ncbi:MAG TPA: ABC transporter permease, partial [Chitinophagales bacterium]|nr:ABC transporter permease [Chitinophagales bacterium]